MNKKESTLTRAAKPNLIPKNNSVVMVKVWFLRLKNQKNSLQWHQYEINDIYNAYYQTNEVPSTVVIQGGCIENEPQKNLVYSHSVTNILNRFKIRSAHELMFLLAQHPKNQKIPCEYCKEGFVFTNRTSKTVTCGHSHYCRFENCKEPLKDYSYCDKHRHSNRGIEYNSSNVSHAPSQINRGDILTNYAYTNSMANFDVNHLFDTKSKVGTDFPAYITAEEKGTEVQHNFYSGMIFLKTSPEIHKHATMIAKAHGKDLNTWIEELLLSSF
ncbi:MAG: toxin-antitoxin system HicB family antitoxin [Gammaproteobacteria bacterium]